MAPSQFGALQYLFIFDTQNKKNVISQLIIILD